MQVFILEDAVSVADIAWWITNNSTLGRVLHQTCRLALALALAYSLAMLGKSARRRSVDDELFDFVAACFHIIARNLLVKHGQCRLIQKIITYLVVRRIKG